MALVASSTAIPASCPAGCGSGRRSCARSCTIETCSCWTSHLEPWTPKRGSPCRGGCCRSADFHKTVLFVTHDIDESIYLSDVVYVLSGRPGRVKAVVALDIERPRSQLVMTSSQFMKLKHELLTLLSEGEPQADSVDGGVGAQGGLHA